MCDLLAMEPVNVLRTWYVDDLLVEALGLQYI